MDHLMERFKIPSDVLVQMTQGERREFADRLDRRLLRRREQEETAKWFASREWDWFLTLTFPLRSPDEHHTLEWCKRQWHRHLIVPFSKRLWGRRWRRNRKGLFGVVTWERQRNGAWHAHALVSGTRRLRQWEVVDYCAEHRVLGWAECYPAPTEKQRLYVAKYVTKGPNVWAVFGFWRDTTLSSKVGPLFDPTGRADGSVPASDGDGRAVGGLAD